MPTYSQTHRLLAIETPFPADEILLNSFTGAEAISRLSHFELDLLSEKTRILAKDIIGKPVKIRVTLADGHTHRYFHGHIVRWIELGRDQRFSRYRAEMVPWLWYLTQTRDCRIFQEMTVPEIIDSVLTDLGFADFDLSGIQGKHPAWEYCVQYRETAFDFLSRLMEQEGIFYYFRNDPDKQILVLGDQPNTHKPCPHQSAIDWRDANDVNLEDDAIFRWERQFAFRSGAWAMKDYNFKTAGAALLTSVPTVLPVHGAKQWEIFEFPGEYTKMVHGENLVRLRMEEEECGYDTISGEGNCRTFGSGFAFTIYSAERPEHNGDYVLTSVTHKAGNGGFQIDGGTLGTYENSFECIPAAVRFRPPRATPVPVVQGLQSAIVTGPDGEEIYTDKYGRVKVQFHWDRYGKFNAKSSCWIRVSHPWAGKNWGSIAIPRIGQEVLVEFLEGDPDRPVIVGRVYNSDNMPPYALPAEANNMGFKSKSVKGGGYNEISVNDSNAAEGIEIHAQHNMNERVNNDHTISVGNNRTEEVGVNETVTIGSNRTEKVGANEDITIGGDRTENVAGKETVTIGGNRIHTVAQNEVFTVGLTRTHSVGINEAITVGGAQEVSVGGVRLVNVGLAQMVTVGLKHHLHAGSTISLDSSGDITINAADKISITCGASSIVLDKGSITIKSPAVLINS